MGCGGIYGDGGECWENILQRTPTVILTVKSYFVKYLSQYL